MDIEICNDCLVDSGFEAFATVTHSEDPLACSVCGREFWKLNVAKWVGSSTYTQDFDTFTDADPGL